MSAHARLPCKLCGEGRKRGGGTSLLLSPSPCAVSGLALSCNLRPARGLRTDPADPPCRPSSMFGGPPGQPYRDEQVTRRALPAPHRSLPRARAG